MRLSLLALAISAGMISGIARGEGTPKLQFDQTVYDFGKTSQVERVTGTFTFKNVGDGVLKINKPTTSCGCTVAGVKPDVLEPGEKGELTFILNLGTAKATLQKSITVTSNDPQTPSIQLTIKAEYTPLYEVTPTMVRIDLRKGETTNTTVAIKRTDGKKINITKMDPTKPWIAPNLIPALDHDEQTARISIDLKPEGPLGQFSEALRVFSDDTNKPITTIFVSGRLLGDITLTGPGTLYWSVTDPAALKKEGGEALNTRRLIASSTVPGKSFELHNPTSSIKEVSVELVPKENGKTYEIVAKLAEVPKETIRGTITIESNLSSQPKLEVPITVSVLKPLKPLNVPKQ
jgi:hypothetical protein